MKILGFIIVKKISYTCENLANIWNLIFIKHHDNNMLYMHRFVVCTLIDTVRMEISSPSFQNLKDPLLSRSIMRRECQSAPTPMEMNRFGQGGTCRWIIFGNRGQARRRSPWCVEGSIQLIYIKGGKKNESTRPMLRWLILHGLHVGLRYSMIDFFR